jgi:hypothetical protein
LDHEINDAIPYLDDRFESIMWWSLFLRDSFLGRIPFDLAILVRFPLGGGSVAGALYQVSIEI